MPEANKKELVKIAEKMRKSIEVLELSQEKGDRLTVSCGISENPLDGATSQEIMEKAKGYCDKAKEKGKNTVIGLEV